MSPEIIGYLVGGLVTLLAAIWTTLGSRRTAQAEARVREITANADAAKSTQEVYAGIVEDLRTEVDRLHTEVGELRVELQAARRLIERMAALLAQNNIPFTPEEA